ncbi:MAG: hypothetical protein AAF968_00410 [Pseudomonadota bacterium]
MKLRVSDEMRALYSAFRAGRASPPSHFKSPVTAEPEIDAHRDEMSEASEVEQDDKTRQLPWRSISLRRHGARPLRIMGLQVFSIHATDRDGGRHTIELFMESSWKLVLRTVFEPSDTVAAWPLHQARAVVSRPGGFGDAVFAHDPAEAFSASAPATARQAAVAAFQAMAQRLGLDLEPATG